MAVVLAFNISPVDKYDNLILGVGQRNFTYLTKLAAIYLYDYEDTLTQ